MVFLRLFLVLPLFFSACLSNDKSFYFSKISEGVYKAEHVYHAEQGNQEESRILIFKINPEKFDFEVLDGAARLVFEWGEGYDEGIFVNGGFFDAEFNPTGFLVSHQERIGRNIYDKDKSAVFLVQDDEVSIVENFDEEASFSHAIQNFPLLIRNGENNIKEDSKKKARRTAIGMDKEDFFYVLVAQNRDLSLFAFAEEIEKMPIEFTRVLNLDGGNSTGLYIKLGNFTENIFSFAKVPNIIRISPK